VQRWAIACAFIKCAAPGFYGLPAAVGFIDAKRRFVRRVQNTLIRSLFCQQAQIGLELGQFRLGGLSSTGYRAE
jgi:hypothetical protein